MHLGQGAEEPGAGVDGIDELAGRSPSRRGPLLEDADRVQVSVVGIVQVRLLHRGRVGHGERAGRHAAAVRHPGDGRRDLRLLGVECDRRMPCARGAAGLPEDRRHVPERDVHAGSQSHHGKEEYQRQPAYPAFPRHTT